MQAEVLLHTQQAATPHASVQYWRVCQVEELYDLPFMDLVFRAAQVHREHFNPNEIQLSSLLSIKTGGCPEDCAYCPQSAHYDTGVEKQALLQIEDIVAKAKIAKERGASRFCMGAAWRGPHQRDMDKLTARGDSIVEHAVPGLDAKDCKVSHKMLSLVVSEATHLRLRTPHSYFHAGGLRGLFVGVL